MHSVRYHDIYFTRFDVFSEFIYLCHITIDIVGAQLFVYPPIMRIRDKKYSKSVHSIVEETIIPVCFVGIFSRRPSEYTYY